MSSLYCSSGLETIHILYTSNHTPLSKEKWYKYTQYMPEKFMERIQKFRRWEDRQNSLTGRLLLKKGLSLLEYLPGNESIQLDSIKLTHLGKPYFSEQVTSYIKFNISHSGHYAVCALHSKQIGVDIEKIHPVSISDFHSILTSEEEIQIKKSIDPLRDFFSVWTRKEAVIKGKGTGLSKELSSVCVSKNPVKLDEESWYLYPIHIAPEYSGHIATEEKEPRIIMKQIFF
ncbi:putative phosphopantetheinyl transferase [Desulfamplus magnetovallimortis]|uniref:Putative phosphopantetheinyl transferase n=1 Tax=Desulfamplus magnetovallimortis TaxID=1246637 RepID=A0A1W1H4Z2_9BACT|nr:4'-phosphopantetheinyl transferase superfamily protein [Desulfamplus magnetovallimortis]SLM27438.1 putative phosphopantetheinyl transferase [Desulfamplus magnetovallimortis]